MGTRTEHPPGTFSWIDLTTGDVAGAKAFYGALFGWEFEDRDEATFCLLDGGYVAAIPPGTDRFEPHWTSYVTVASADDAAARARELGASVLEPPTDVGDLGRTALVIDPTGAAVRVWEPRTFIGATLVNEPGSLTWNELHTPDHDRALEFYAGLFGWTAEPIDTQGGPRVTGLKAGGRGNGNVVDAQPGEPPAWLPYLVVEDRDAAAEQATALGASELARLDLPTGRIAVLGDPHGAVFGILDGETED